MKWIMIAAVVFAFFGSHPAMAAEPVRIGTVSALSGPFEHVGRTYVAGVKFAIDEQNARGGLLGRKIEHLIQDDEFKPDVAVRRARGLILENKIHLLDGAVSSAGAIALNQVATLNKTIMINHNASADVIQGKEFSRYAFRVSFSNYGVTAALARAMASKPYRRFYLINMDYALGRDFARVFKEQLKIHVPDAQIVGEDYHPSATKDFGPYVNKIISSNAEVVFTCNFGPDFTNLVKQGRSLGLKASVPFLTMYGGDPAVLYELKDAAIGIYDAQSYSMRVKTPENEKLLAAYHAQHKNDKDFLTWWPYPQIGQTILGWRMVFAAIEKAGSLDPEKIIGAFEGFKYESAVGTFTMRACDHQVLLPMFVGVVEGGANPFYDGSIRQDVKFPYTGPNLITVPAEQAAIPATPDYNPRCK